jgi:hypothetical protein
MFGPGVAAFTNEDTTEAIQRSITGPYARRQPRLVRSL